MKITNVSVTRERGTVTATSNVHGYTFTHDQDCSIIHAAEHSTINDHPVPWTDTCDCLLSRVEVTAINGVPVGTFKPRWWERHAVIFGAGYITCGIASFISRMFFGGGA